LIKKRASFALQTTCELHTPPLLQIAIKSKAKHKEGKGIITIRAHERRQPEWNECCPILIMRLPMSFAECKE
jgi:hypothetical protein